MKVENPTKVFWYFWVVSWMAGLMVSSRMMSRHSVLRLQFTGTDWSPNVDTGDWIEFWQFFMFWWKTLTDRAQDCSEARLSEANRSRWRWEVCRQGDSRQEQKTWRGKTRRERRNVCISPQSPTGVAPQQHLLSTTLPFAQHNRGVSLCMAAEGVWPTFPYEGKSAPGLGIGLTNVDVES